MSTTPLRLFALCGSFFLGAHAAAQFAQNVPPTAAHVDMLGKTHDPNFAATVYRDSGASASANGYHMMIFADTMSSPNPPGPNMIPAAHNSLAYMGYNDPHDPTSLYDFGSQVPHVQSEVLAAPMTGKPNSNETNDDYGFWPSSNMVTLADGKTVVGLFPFMDIPKSTAMYSSMFEVILTDPKTMGSGGPLTTRVVDQFFYANEPMYGGLSVLKGVDGYLYWFAAAPDGVKVARSLENDRRDRAKWQYYDGHAWGAAMPALHDTGANIIQFSKPGLAGNLGPGTGDCFWSNWHVTFVCVFMDSGMDGTFWMAYSKTGSVTGPWSDATALWTPDPNPTFADECEQYNLGGRWNYAGHAHPAWDISGQTLLLSWSSCMTYVPMAKVTFAGAAPKLTRDLDAHSVEPVEAAVVEPTVVERTVFKRAVAEPVINTSVDDESTRWTPPPPPEPADDDAHDLHLVAEGSHMYRHFRKHNAHGHRRHPRSFSFDAI